MSPSSDTRQTRELPETELIKNFPYAGQHLISTRKGYEHHGLGDDRGGVIHYSGFANGPSGRGGTVCRTDLGSFSLGHGFVVRPYRYRKYSLRESIERAKTRLGESSYQLPGNNCEHFVTWCITGYAISRQVDKVVGYFYGAGTLITLVGLLEIFALCGGIVVGSLGLLSFLSDIKVGSGALLLMAGVSGFLGMFLTLVLNTTALRDVPGLPTRERAARSIARIIAYLAVCLGTVGAFSLFSTRAFEYMYMGVSFSDLRVALIIASGVTLPVIASVALGYGSYKILRLLPFVEKLYLLNRRMKKRNNFDE